MDIENRIEYFANNLNIKFAKNNIIKLNILVNEIRRYVKRQFCGEKSLKFNSQNLRRLTIAIEKVLKATNKYITFISFQKRLETHKTVGKKEFMQEVEWLKEYVALSKHLNNAYCEMNYYSTLTYLIETEEEQKSSIDVSICKAFEMLEQDRLESIEEVLKDL